MHSIFSSSVKTRIQADVGSSQKAKAINAKEGKPTMKKGTSLSEGLIAIIKSKEGVKGLYRGFGASMVNTFSTREYSRTSERRGVWRDTNTDFKRLQNLLISTGIPSYGQCMSTA